MAAPVPGNMLLSVPNYGTYSLQCIALHHGINIIQREDVARMSKALYVTKRTSGSFIITVIFPTHAEQEKFSNWLQEYGRRRSNPNAANTTIPQAMRAMLPARKFDKYGVPAAKSAGIPYGDRAAMAAYRTTIEFVGTRDVLEDSSPAISSFTAPTGDKAAPYFYPAGEQLGKGEKGEDWLYNVDNSVDARGNIGDILQTGPKEPNIPVKPVPIGGGAKVF